MDKNTLSNYGWIVIAVLVLSVMIALATPFGEYIKAGVESTTAGLFDTSEKALNVVGMSAETSSTTKASGEIIALRGVSEISHNIKCSISGVSNPASVTVYRYGKNLFDLSQWTCSNNTVTAEILSNNSIKFNNPTEYDAGIRTIDWIFTLPKGTYTLSGYTEDFDTTRLSIYEMEDSGSWSNAYQCLAKNGESVSITLNKQRQVKITLFAPKGVITFNNLQLEVGNTATEIEEYIIPVTYTPQADGTVNGITSLSPNMTLFTDTDDVVIECEYSKKKQ